MAFDPNFANVSLLLHADGENASTTFTDSSPTPRTITRFGNTQISTAQSKFGGSSIYFDGSGDYLTTPSGTHFDFGAGDFTIEAWVCITGALNVYRPIILRDNINSTRGWLLLADSDNAGKFNFMIYVGTTMYSVKSTAAAPLNSQTHIAVTRSGTSLRLFVNGALNATTTITGTVNTLSQPACIGAIWLSNAVYTVAGTMLGYIDELRVTKGLARYTASFTPQEEEFGGAPPAALTTYAQAATPLAAPAAIALFGNDFYARAASPGVLNSASVLAQLGVVSVYSQASGILGDASALGLVVQRAYVQSPSLLAAAGALVYEPQLGLASAHTPLGAVNALSLHDFSDALGDAVTGYGMDLVTPAGTLRVPISSWQATLQTGSSNYVQCVIPACGVWVNALNSATQFSIMRTAMIPGAGAFEYEMARAPAEQLQFSLSPDRYTCTLSGYSTAFAESENPPAVYDRELTGLRTISSGSAYRVRCAVDWLLRPGHRAFVQGDPFVVRYINYYAPTGFDSYMDVGS